MYFVLYYIPILFYCNTVTELFTLLLTLNGGDTEYRLKIWRNADRKELMGCCRKEPPLNNFLKQVTLNIM
jgi:hypothetical protein